MHAQGTHGQPQPDLRAGLETPVRHRPRLATGRPTAGRSKACRQASAPGSTGAVAFWIAVAFSAFQIWTAAYGTLPSQVVRAMHVGFLLLLGFGAASPTSGADAGWPGAGSGRSALLGFGTGLYNWVFYADLIRRSGFLTAGRPRRRIAPDRAGLRGGAPADGAAADHHRRASSSPTASSASTCRRRSIHRGYDFAQIIEHFAFGTEGIYGTPIYVSAAYIFIFVLFAAFLERAGMIALFNDVALGLVGGLARRAGAGLRAVLGADGHDLRLGRRQCGGQRASSPSR